MTPPFHITQLQTDSDTGETAWIWHGILSPGKVTLLTSLWKSGKTTLLAHLLAHRRREQPFLGQAVTPGRTMIVSEEPPDLWPMRARRLDLGAEVRIATRPFAGRPTLADFEILTAELLKARQQEPFDLLVFDSLAQFLPSRSENFAGAMNRGLAPFIALADAGLAVLLLHHPAKGERRLGEAARGSGALLAAVDIILEMRHAGGDPFTQRRKINAWSRFRETPRHMLIELSRDGTHYDRVVDTGPVGQSADEVLRALLAKSTRPLSMAEIQDSWPLEARPLSDTALWRWLNRAVTTGRVTRQGHGSKAHPYLYGLAG